MVPGLYPSDLFEQAFKRMPFHWQKILRRILSCDSVIDGAFFSHPDFQVPEEKMGQHAR
jgi:hypothetical protein